MGKTINKGWVIEVHSPVLEVPLTVRKPDYREVSDETLKLARLLFESQGFDDDAIQQDGTDEEPILDGLAIQAEWELEEVPDDLSAQSVTAILAAGHIRLDFQELDAVNQVQLTVLETICRAANAYPMTWRVAKGF